MSVGELGEFELIRRLTDDLGTRPDVVLGVGDDAAVLIPPPGAQLVAACDAQVAGEHFTFASATPEEIGHKALAVNLSDMAAMGAQPLWALVSLLLPRDLPAATLERVYAGMRTLARRFSVAIVGGNIAATTGPFTLDITVLGACAPGQAVTRGGGQPGDAVLVVGTLGMAAAGLLLSEIADLPEAVSPEARARAHQALCVPEPLVVAGRALAERQTVSAMLDISDGFAADLGHLCARSDVGALIEAAALPLDPVAVAIGRALGRDPLALALHGGEDYALLCAVRPAAVEHALATVRAAGSEARVIGALTAPEDGLRLRTASGEVVPLEPRGWDHLRQTSRPTT
jgi:thiamine-monophosphate kinase